MKVLLQRVSSAAVHVDGETVGAIGRGLLVYLGIERNDTPAGLEAWAEKLARLRIFEDGDGRMERDVLEVSGAVLLVSQFTLAGSTRRGRRPSWDGAAPGARAEPLYRAFAERLRALGVPVETGTFGAHMQVESVNDGPVTLLLDPPGSRRKI